ncbi:MAG: hypothetical protein RLZZ299_2088 [Pseudomonadota bacterium]
MIQLVARALVLLGVAIAAWAQPRADATRFARHIAQSRVFIPDATATKLAASGFEQGIAALLWSRAVLEYGGAMEQGDAPPADLGTWFHRMVDAAHRLDPRWRTPLFWGGTLARTLGDIPASNTLFEAGARAFPEDAFFPANRAMNAYIHEDDPATSAVWMARAAALPNAAFWYATDVAHMHELAGQRDTAIRFLEEGIAAAEEPHVRADLERSLRKVRHNALVDTWAEACRTRAGEGRPLRRPEELAELGFVLPPNPRGDAWVVGRDGVVRSEASEVARQRRMRLQEWAWVRP